MNSQNLPTAEDVPIEVVHGSQSHLKKRRSMGMRRLVLGNGYAVHFCTVWYFRLVHHVKADAVDQRRPAAIGD